MRAVLVMMLLLSVTARAQDELSFENEGIIDAPIEEVWKILSTSEGYKAMGPALAEVDLRIGGTIRSRYRAGGRLGDDETIENLILAYEPPTMIATRISKTPQSFPFKTAWKNPWTVVTLKSIDGNRTAMRVASLGYGSDEVSLAMRRFFESGNQETIENIRKHFASAPAHARP